VTSYTGTSSSNDIRPNTIWRISSHDGLIYVVVIGLTVENREDIVKIRELNPRKDSPILSKYPKKIFLEYYHYVQ